MAFSRIDLAALSGSPHVAELKRCLAGQQFGNDLERQYVSTRLAENRTLIQVTCVLGAVLSLVSGARHGFGGELSDDQLAQVGLMLLSSVMLAVVACTFLFDRLYLPLARIVVPIRNAVAAAFVSLVVARGQPAALMVLPLMIVGPFFFLGLPFRTALVSAGATIASFAVASAVTGAAFDATATSCSLLIAVGVACFVAARHIDERSRKSFLEGRVIAQYAEHDSLTGISNRRVFDQHFARLWRSAVDGNRMIAVLLIDVDHFKAYNDRHGHQAGDRALRRVAETLQTCLRQPDLLARYGGEEFVVVLNDVQSEVAVKVAERMRLAVSELALDADGGGPVTISVGVAAVTPAADRGPRGVLQLADQALYEAKVSGRNRVELMEETDYQFMVTGVFSTSTAPGMAGLPAIARPAKAR
jgi:diguanylate cyclase (GGDEF)-like protein